MKMTPKKINENAEKKKRAFIEARKEEIKTQERAMNLAAEKIVSGFLKNNPLKDFDKELIEKCKNITLGKIVDRALEKKKCPMLTKDDNDWDCFKSGCHKGEEKYCENIGFLNCPAINNYFNHEMIMKPLRKRQSEKRAKEKEAKRKDK